MEGSTPTTMASVISLLGEIVSFFIEQVGTVFGIIQQYPIALIGVGIVLSFAVVRFAKYILGI